MDKIFVGEIGKFVIPYFDDIIVFSEDIGSHKEHLQIILNRIKTANILLNKNKCKFCLSEVKILGNIVSEGRIRTDPEKVEAIRNRSIPQTLKELRSFLGLANYCRDFIPKFAAITYSLFEILKGESKRSTKQIEWNKESSKAFFETKNAIVKFTERAQPDITISFILTTDASDRAIGAILSQRRKDGKEVMISCSSKSLDQAQRNYGITDRELLAIVKALEHYRYYLLGKKFELRTDHKALTYLHSAKNPNTRLFRWSMKLQDYNFEVKYIKGESNAADELSRSQVCGNVSRQITRIIEDQETRNQILNEYHINTAHGSENTMKFLLKNKYIWDSMFKDIDTLIKNCSICQKSGGQRINSKNRIIEPTQPNELWIYDIIGKLPTTSSNKSFIFLAIDHYTKWVETKALSSKSSEEVLQAIKELIIKKHGPPQRILSDSGLEFKNKNLNNYFENILGIAWEHASPEHHQTTGAVERVIQCLFNNIRKLNNFSQKNWDKKLKDATLAVNLSYNRSIGTSPHILHMAQSPTFPIDKLLKITSSPFNQANLFSERDKHHSKYSRSSIVKGSKEIKQKFKTGEKVLLYRKVLGSEFKERWNPGFTIKEPISEDAYIVEKNGKLYRANKANLKSQSFNSDGDVVIKRSDCRNI